MQEKERIRSLSRIFILVGLLFAFALVKLVYDIASIAYARTTWAQADGRITRISEKGWWDEEKKKRYFLEYEYEVRSTSYRNARYYLNEESLEGSAIGMRDRSLLLSLGEGGKIPVYYNPSRPGEASLRIEYLREGFLFSYLIIGFLVMVWTLLKKETNWEKVVDVLSMRVSGDYEGRDPLPPVSSLLEDSGNRLCLDTSMSIFWGFGVPFFGFSFIGALLMVLFLEPLNPSWSLLNYMGILAGIWAGNFAVGLLFTRIRHLLEIDSETKEVREITTSPMGRRLTKYGFPEIDAVRLFRERWQDNNTLRQWTMMVQTKTGRPLFVSCMHRDKQPASFDYLGILKKRMEYMIFGSSRGV